MGAIDVRAAVADAGAELRIEDLTLDGPHAGEVLVRLGAAGVCHSDVSVLDGTLPSRFPIVLGHEGAGTVVEIGEGVESLAPGDRVALSWLAQCGECFYCRRGQPALCEVAARGMSGASMPDGTTRFRRGAEPVAHMLGLGVFAEHCVVPATAAHRIPDDVGFPQAALIGCGVLTGFGAAVNSADIAAGDSVAVIGCGGVGLNAIQGAVVAGATTVVAIDPAPTRRELAIAFGATVAFAPDDDVLDAVRGATEGRGVDVAIEAVGRAETVRLSVRLTRPGGQTVLVGAAPPDVRLSVPVFAGMVTTEKSIRGSLYGSSLVSRDIARLVEHYRRGEVKLDELVTSTFPLAEVGRAIEYCAGAHGARAIVVPG